MLQRRRPGHHKPADVGGGQAQHAQACRQRVHGAGTAALAPGQPLFERDTIRTGPESSVGITMKDGTMLSAGPDTELMVDHYAYAPAEGNLGFAARVSQGTLDFVSGMLGKLAPESVSVETPTGVIGMRGTHFVVKVAPGQKFADEGTGKHATKKG